jgi:hypothetical protein
VSFTFAGMIANANRNLHFIILLIGFITWKDLQAGNPEKAFERLKVFDYFKARELFIKCLKKDPATGGYGLARIYSTPDNPFYNLDSASVKILLCDSVFQQLKDKKKLELNKLGIHAESISALKDSICRRAMREAENQYSVTRFNHYLNHYAFCGQREYATEMRNTIAFREARNLNTSEAYKQFMALYPDASEMRDATNRYHERVFEEETQSRQLGAYERFLSLYPESPFRMQAERMIYSLSTSQGTISEHKAFIDRYPDNRYVKESWREIYRLSMQDYDEQTFLRFRFDFPDYPFEEELESDYKIQSSLFLPFKKGNLWGYINQDGIEMIPALYEEVNYFSEGLAVVLKDGQYGYINKRGKVVIPFMWDDAEPFINHCAVVSRKGKYGLLGRNGDLLIPLEYDELTEPVEEICVVMKDNRSAYMDIRGNVITGFDFDVAEDFRNGFAIVGSDDLYGLINHSGETVVEISYDHLSWASDDLLKASLNGKWGFINRVGQVILPLIYDATGSFSEARALVALNGKCGFVNTAGDIIIPLNYRFTENMLSSAVFRNGFVLMTFKGKNTVLDSLGNRLQFSSYENTGIPNEGFIPVQKNRKWGFADIAGRLKIPCTFQEVSTFTNSTAIGRTNNLNGIIDTTGNWMLSPDYEAVSRVSGHFILQKHGLYGMFSRKGILIADCDYDRVEILFDRVAMLQKEDTRTYVSIASGDIIWGRVD